MPSRTFPRALSSLSEIFRFMNGELADLPAHSSVVADLRLAVDELFSNMVRHQPHGAPCVDVDIERREGRIVIGLVDSDVDPFDPASAPEPDLDVPLAARREGGLGIYLARRLMASVRYEYDPGRRRSVVTIEKLLEE